VATEPQYGGDPVRFEPHEVLWFRYPNPIDEFSAMSPAGGGKAGRSCVTADQATTDRQLIN